MSKRFWLPTRKGTELSPNTYQQPTKLVIRDVPAGTPLHDAVTQEFGGRLKQFHGKAQQDYSLSGNQQYRRHIEWAGARATYTNQFGNETLELEVDVPTLVELQQQITDRWRWALVEFKFPRSRLNLASMYAKIRGTQFDTLQTTVGIGDDSAYYHDFRQVAFAGTAPNRASGADVSIDPDADHVTMSLLVDLQVVSRGAALVDVYARGIVSTDIITAWRVTKTSQVTEHAFSAADGSPYATQLATWQTEWDAAGLPHTLNHIVGWGTVFPATILVDGYAPPHVDADSLPPDFADGWHYATIDLDILGRPVSTSGASLYWGGTGASAIQITDWATSYYSYSDLAGFGSAPSPGPGSIRGLMFRQDPVLVFSEWDNDGTENFRWLPRSSAGPDWVTMSSLADSINWPVAGTDDITDAGNFLGTLICDVDHGALVFQPHLR